MQQARIAVVGGGAIGLTHLDAIARAQAAQLAGLVEPGPRGTELAAANGCPLYPDLDALLHSKPDGVIIATPNALHVPQAIACLEAGIPVLVEKPLAESAKVAQTLVDTACRLGLPALVGHHRRHNPILSAARKVVTEGRFGTLVTGSILVTLKKPDSYFDLDWRRAPGSGGPILINLIHEIDLVRYLFGEIVEVQAMTSSRQRGFAVEDSATVLLRMAAGGLVTITLTDAGIGPWCWDTTAGENPARFPANDATSHLFSGTLAGLTLPGLDLWTHEGAPDWTNPQRFERLTVTPADPYVGQIDHFADIIAGRDVPRVSLADGAANLRVVEAIRRAVDEKCCITIDQPSPAAPSDLKELKE